MCIRFSSQVPNDVRRLKEIRLKNTLAKDDIVGESIYDQHEDIWGDLSCARFVPITTQVA